MKVLASLVAVALLSASAFFGVKYFHLEFVFGVAIPYGAFFIGITGFIAKILTWAKSPVPFNITATSGQQKSLDWIKPARFENPSSGFGVLGRMFLEVVFFRSLFRNTKAGLIETSSGNFKPGYGSEKSLWLGGLLFHWSFLYLMIRHLRFFLYPVPDIILSLEKFDAMFQIGLPIFYITDAIFLLSVTFLFFRRMVISPVKYISLVGDYFPLIMIFTIGLSGIIMRYFTRVDAIGVKQLMMGLANFHPVVSENIAPENISPLFYTHLFLVSFLFMYFPFSKLMHMGGVFFSPTRNMTGDSRRLRHINPWNYSVDVHSYEEYENEFKDVMKGAGIPLEKD
jgi:nitrate reductase gamma subunit